MECVTYCYNEKCYKKYKCKRYRDFNNLDGREFWFDKLDPKLCGEGE